MRNQRALSITHESINFSPSKQKYSFSKGDRFKSISGRTPSEFTVTLKDTFNKRSPSFGVGERFRERIRNDIPPLGTYKLDTSFNTENAIYMPKQLKYTFGNSAGRDDYNKVYNPMDNSPRGNDAKLFPGPGEYKYKNMNIGVDAKKFSFLKRCKNPQD